MLALTVPKTVPSSRCGGLRDSWHRDAYGQFDPLRVGPVLTVGRTVFEMWLGRL